MTSWFKKGQKGGQTTTKRCEFPQQLEDLPSGKKNQGWGTGGGKGGVTYGKRVLKVGRKKPRISITKQGVDRGKKMRRNGKEKKEKSDDPTTTTSYVRRYRMSKSVEIASDPIG